MTVESLLQAERSNSKSRPWSSNHEWLPSPLETDVSCPCHNISREIDEQVGINKPSDIRFGSLEYASDCALSVLVEELEVGSIHDRSPEQSRVEGVLFVQWWRNRFKWFLHGWLSPVWREALKGCVWMEMWFQRRSKNHSHHHSAVW